MVNWGIVVDLEKCVGCQTCLMACKVNNSIPEGIKFNETVDYETGKFPDVGRIFLPVQCMHCERPVCMDVCPADAVNQTDTGIVWTDPEVCVGCKSCMSACPYGARSYFDGEVSENYEGTPVGRRIKEENEKDTVLKCDFCRERVEEGMEKGLTPGEDPEATPYCIISCIADARTFGDLDDPDSEVSRKIRNRDGNRLHPEHDTEPKIYYVK